MTDQPAGDFGEIRSVGRGLGLLEIMQRAAPAGSRVCEPSYQSKPIDLRADRIHA